MKRFQKTLIRKDKNASPARLPTAIPIIVSRDKELDLEDDALVPELESELVLEPVGPGLKIFVEVWTEPSAAVIIACTVTGSGSAV